MGANPGMRIDAVSLSLGERRDAVASAPNRINNIFGQARRATGNFLVATLFFVSAWPNARDFLHAGVADQLWVIGAVMMGAMSLVRLPPRSSRLELRGFSATMAMFALPGLMRATAAQAAIVGSVGIGLEIAGMALQQTARVYLGRSFGILPANRGIVVSGPFRFVRHPIYTGWLVSNLGFALSYPGWRNSLLLVVMLPFMIWRARLEEDVLLDDPEYASYARRVTYRVIPGVL